jgi:hypothetical protein
MAAQLRMLKGKTQKELQSIQVLAGITLNDLLKAKFPLFDIKKRIFQLYESREEAYNFLTGDEVMEVDGEFYAVDGYDAEIQEGIPGDLLNEFDWDWSNAGEMFENDIQRVAESFWRLAKKYPLFCAFPNRKFYELSAFHELDDLIPIVRFEIDTDHLAIYEFKEEFYIKNGRTIRKLFALLSVKTHPRLGLKSPIRFLPIDLIRSVFNYVVPLI